MSTKEKITEIGLRDSAAKVAPPGTLLIAMYGQGKTRGKTAILGISAAMNQACAAVEPNNDISTTFLFHFLKARYGLIRGMSNAGGQENLSGEIIKKIPVVIPTRAEQDRIAEMLDDMDALVGGLERLIAKKQAIKQGMMQQLLTCKTRLPGFADKWIDIRLGDHVAYIKTVALSRAELDDNSPLRYLHYGDIHTNTRLRLDAAQEEMPRASAVKTRNAGRLQVGDLVFADASEDPDGVGKSVEIVSIPAAGVVPGLHTIAARFDKAVIADGFKAYLQFFPGFREALLRLAAGTKVLATTRTYISSIVLRLPGVDEQRVIAAVLLDADADIEVLQHRLDTTQAIKQGMMQELLTGRTRLHTAKAA